ncbi:hypothetical protein F993_00061 [Acinetobacter proteolyticus]|uniref:Uncharacterized protein n=1 Tax=Acinetobacter proteolyticus TaxID=1776741 RepID=A0ABN0JJ54_9GAMM|nr:hypothetical protein [Acinetobacter proteolyticus]ENU25287.1 hypothetical protein F993_00061 [Acinetobacter proteolyticus]
MHLKLQPSIAFLCLALIYSSLSYSASPYSSTKTWPIKFEDFSSSLMQVKYNSNFLDNTLYITPSIEYIDNLKKSTPITAEHFWYSPFEWNLPRLSVKTENSTNNEILLEKVVFTVNSSQFDQTPIPIFIKDATRAVTFYNDGWGALINTEIEMGLQPESVCNENVVVSKSSFQQIKKIKVGRILESKSIEIDDLITPTLKENMRVCAVGILSYTDELKNQWRVPFRTSVRLEPPGSSMPAPPNTTYDLYLPAGKSGYTIELPISQSIPAKGTDHFQIAVYSDKSAIFNITATVFSARGKKVTKSNVKLIYFRPRSVGEPTTSLSKFKNVDSKLFNIKSLAPYINSVGYDPLHPDSFVIQATDEWMLLTDNKKITIHKKIESSLRKLKLSRASYCYLLNDKCIRTGPFDW